MNGDNWQVITGDCLDVMRGMEAGLSFTGVSLPFNKHMAVMAKANEIAKLISLFVVGAIRKSLDMMHVKFLAILRFGYAAFLTRVLVALSGLASLGLPIRAVVSLIATTPRRVIFTGSVGVATAKATKRNTTFARAAVAWVVKLLAAISARQPVERTLTFRTAGRFNHSRFAFGGIGVWGYNLSLDDTPCPSDIKTLKRTDIRVLNASDIRRSAAKRLSTNGTFHIDACGFLFGSKYVGTLPAASGLPSVLKSAGVGKVLFLANGAGERNVFRHTELYPTMFYGATMGRRNPFAGSGSTGCAAVMEGRSFIGIELSDEYAEIARARIAHAEKQVPVAEQGSLL